MAVPEFTMRQLLEAGVHFGHQTHRWNPKMQSYIYGSRNGIHIIDLAQTVPLLHQALLAVTAAVAKGGRVLFVGTKRTAQEQIADSAKRSAQYYVNSRWLGGMLTNWKTISNSIKHLRTLDEQLAKEGMGLTKREMLSISREKTKLDKALGGIKDMGGVPDLLFVIDTNKEKIAIEEANRLNIPVAAIIDSNCDPDRITYPIPGNDDAGRAITLYCDLIAKAALDGIGRAQGDAGIDIGAAVEVNEPAILDSKDAGVDMSAAEVVEPAGELDRSKASRTPVTPLFTKPAGKADDLKKITGVGPALERKLNALGVTRYDQIAAFSDEEAEKVDAALNYKGRVTSDDWIGQAKTLATA
jgi:small subunit ribosomal protein S2